MEQPAHIILDDESLRNRAEEIKHVIWKTLLSHHLEHSTIELERPRQCKGNVCEEKAARENE